jgi:hypothetical protein
LAPDVGKRAYDLFVEDIKAITNNSELCDVNLVLGDFNLPKVRWKVNEESGSVLPLNVTTDLESDLVSGFVGCDLDQVNVVHNDSGTFLDLMFTNAPVDDSPLLKLDRYHRVYEIGMWVCCCKFEAVESRTQRYMFRMTDCAAIVNELDEDDWFSLFSGKRMRFSRGGRKLPWITGELNCLKNNETKAAKRSKKTIDDCECEQGNFFHSKKSIS